MRAGAVLACAAAGSVAALQVPGGPPTRASNTPPLQTFDRRSALSTAFAAGVLNHPEIVFAGETSENKYFPNAISSARTEESVFKALSARGYNKDNTIFGMSVCSDEVNYVEKEVIDLMRTRWGESFSLGGLAGVPFAGKAGLSAFAHHVPDDGKLFIMFAPHVGVDTYNKVGKLERVGQSKPSTACGAAVGAFKALSKQGATVPSGFTDADDLQITYIIEQLAPKLLGLNDAFADDLAFVTYEMYRIVRDAMMVQIRGTPSIWDGCTELAVLGGIQINRYKGGDRFLPLMFQTTTKDRVTNDLYKSTFGEPPELKCMMNSQKIADEILMARL